jgi:hypothetical protein
VDQPTQGLGATIDGYCGGNQFVTGLYTTLRGIGYHLGSELLADDEFTKIDLYLRDKHHEFVQRLMRSTVELHGDSHRSYAWIGIHSGANTGSGVEQDHFDAGLTAANLALQYLNSNESAGEAKNLIIEGYNSFALDRAVFFSWLYHILTEQVNG